jgi:hypothetical protein
MRASRISMSLLLAAILIVPAMGYDTSCTLEEKTFEITDVGYNYLEFGIHGGGFENHELSGSFIHMITGANQWKEFEIYDNTEDTLTISQVQTVTIPFDAFTDVSLGSGEWLECGDYCYHMTYGGSSSNYGAGLASNLPYTGVTKVGVYSHNTGATGYVSIAFYTGSSGDGSSATWSIGHNQESTWNETTNSGILLKFDGNSSLKMFVGAAPAGVTNDFYGTGLRIFMNEESMGTFSIGDKFYIFSYDEGTWLCEGGTVGSSIAVNLLEKYSNAALINQALTVTPIITGSGLTKTSLYGETLYFDVIPGMSYWFNASRAGYQDYNETYTIPASPGIYNVYMERILTPIANKSYAHFSVVDQTNGGLIPNAEVRLSDGQTKLTNSAGYAWFSVNNSEQINYYVSKPSGYWPAYGAMNLTADESILVALQRYTGPTATATIPGWTPITVPTTGTGGGPVVTLSAQLREQNVQEGMDVWYTNLPFISQFLFLLFIIGGLGLMAGGTRRN